MALSNSRPRAANNPPPGPTTVVMDTGKLLDTVKSFLEYLQLSETVFCLEREANLPKLEYPSEIALVREFIENGDWSSLVEFLKILSRVGGIDEIVYAVRKQQFLEALCPDGIRSTLTPDTSVMIQGHLKDLQLHCPSQCEYELLHHLSSLPSLRHHPDFSNWDQKASRQELFQSIGRQVAAVIYADQVDSIFPPTGTSSLPENRLVVLVSKGQLYEHCEKAVKREISSEGKLLVDHTNGYVDLQRCISSKLIRRNHQELVSCPVRVSIKERVCQTKGSSSAGQKVLGGLQSSSNFRSANLPPRSRNLHLVNTANGPSVDSPSPLIETQGNFLTSTIPQSTAALTVSHDTPQHPVVEDDLIISEMEPSPVQQDEDEGIDRRRTLAASSIAGLQVTEVLPKPEPHLSRHMRIDGHSVELNPVSELHSSNSKSVGQLQQGAVGAEHDIPTLTSGGRIGEDLVDQQDAVSTTSGTPPESQSSIHGTDDSDDDVDVRQYVYSESCTPSPTASEPVEPAKLGERKPSSPTNAFNVSPPLATQPKITIRHSLDVPNRFNTPDVAEVQPEGAIDSSTPKPPRSRVASYQGLPPTSPVPYVTGTHGLSDTPHREAVQIRRGLTPLLTDCRAEQNLEQPTADVIQDRHKQGDTESIEAPSIPHLECVGCVKDKQVVRSVAFDPSGKLVAVGANSRCLRICSAEAVASRQPHQNSIDIPILYNHSSYHHGSIYCLSWSNDCVLASGSNDQLIRLLRVDREEGVALSAPVDLNIHNCTVRDVLFLAKDLLVSAGSGDFLVKVTDCSQGETVVEFKNHSSQILALSSQSTNTVLSSGQDKVVNIWDTSTSSPVSTFSLDSPAGSLAVFANTVGFGCLDGSVSLYDKRVFNVSSPLHKWRLHNGECRSVRFSPNGQLLLTGSYDKTIKMVDTRTFASTTAATHKDKVIQSRWHSSGLTCCSCSVDKSACFWKVVF